MLCEEEGIGTNEKEDRDYGYSWDTVSKKHSDIFDLPIRFLSETETLSKCIPLGAVPNNSGGKAFRFRKNTKLSCIRS